MDLIFERTDIIHARISNDSCIQPPLHQIDLKTKMHFKSLWQNVNKKSQSQNQEIPVIIELLSHKIGYDRGHIVNNILEESTDRWEDTLQLKKLTTNWFKKTQTNAL